MLKEVFKVYINNEEVELAVIRPTQQELREAQRVYNKTFKEALDSDAILRERLDDVMRKQSLWNDEKEAEYKQFQKDIAAKEKILAIGGIKKTEARTVALELRHLREKLRNLIATRTSLDSHTAQGQADNARFNCLVSLCTVYNNNRQKYFKDLDDYLSKSNTEVASQASSILASMMYGIESDYESKLPENKVLLRLGFVNDKLELINSDGHRVDEANRLINEDGRFVDKDGNFVDVDGNPIDASGDLIVEQKPFLDDDGNPII